MNDINEMPPKCQYCPYWEICEYPWVCPDREQLATKLQQTCHATDTISRQAAIDAICRSSECESEFCGIPCTEVNALKALPSVQSEQRWIPCSERLPEPDERVLVYTTANEYHVWDAMPHRGEGYEWEDEEGLYHSLYEVAMWLPLPEPYAERRQDG